jgi:hypothetical protein
MLVGFARRAAEHALRTPFFQTVVCSAKGPKYGLFGPHELRGLLDHTKSGAFWTKRSHTHGAVKCL